MVSLKEELEGLELAEPVHFRNLTLFPLLRPAPASAEPTYLLLEDALRTGTARFTEIGAGGSVPEIRFENKGDHDVLLLDGEELVGAKQNRVLNLTILAPARSALTIPVSCVEAGRWVAQSKEFLQSERVMYSAVRAARAADVTASLQQTGARRSDQAAVWDHIAAKASRLQASSPTGAMAAIYERHAIELEEMTRAFQWCDRQAGVLFSVGGQPGGLDLFDHAETMRRTFAKLARSYALDAIDAEPRHSPPATREAAAAFLGRVAESPCFAEQAIGRGKDVRLTASGLSGAALWVDDRYVHLCAFVAHAKAAGGPQTRIARPGLRRQ